MKSGRRHDILLHGFSPEPFATEKNPAWGEMIFLPEHAVTGINDVVDDRTLQGSFFHGLGLFPEVFGDEVVADPPPPNHKAGR